MTDKNSLIELKTDRIVCIDRDNFYLFAEVIDSIAIDDRCWVRPLAIAKSTPESFKLEFLYDLREAAQLVLPAALFRDALDTEVLPLISELFHPDKRAETAANSQRALYQFIADLYRSPQVERE
jgi:hypothetical protein